MPHICLLSVQGAGSAPIPGPIADGVHDGKVLVLAVEQWFEASANAGAANPAGRVTQHELTVTKELDCATPRLHAAMVNGEQLPRVTLQFYVSDDTGAGRLFYTVQLSNVYVHRMHQWSLDANEPDYEAFGHLEDVTFVYRNVTCREEIAGVEAQI